MFCSIKKLMILYKLLFYLFKYIDYVKYYSFGADLKDLGQKGWANVTSLKVYSRRSKDLQILKRGLQILANH